MVPPYLPTPSFHSKSTLCMRASHTSLEKLCKPGPFLAHLATGTVGGLLTLPSQSCFSLQDCCLWEAAAIPQSDPVLHFPCWEHISIFSLLTVTRSYEIRSQTIGLGASSDHL